MVKERLPCKNDRIAHHTFQGSKFAGWHSLINTAPPSRKNVMCCRIELVPVYRGKNSFEPQPSN